MEPTKDTKPGSLQSAFSRRNLLKGAAGLAAAANVTEAFGQWQTGKIGNIDPQIPVGAPFGTVWLYIGTYTGSQPGTRPNNGQGIYLCSLDLSTGKLTVVRLVAGAPPPGTPPPLSTASPSTIALDPTHTHLYAGNEYGPPGAVSAYSINRSTGDLTLLNVQPAVGSPAYVGVDNSGKYLFAAEYTGATFEAFPILGDGSLGPAVFQQFDADNVGPTIPTNGPPGNFNYSAHEGPNGHPHMMQTDPSNQWVIGPDAGQDRIYVWNLTVGNTPPLTPASTPYAPVPPGDGPRHFAFHPNGVWMYSIQEEGDTIIFWQFDPATGSLSNQQQVSSLPPGYAGSTFTSEIRVSNDGRYVYGVNRLSDTIAVFRIGPDGRLAFQNYVSTLGDYPRIITIDPFGMYMVSGNQNADNCTTFKIASDGSLSFTGYYTSVGSPSGMVFLI